MADKNFNAQLTEATRKWFFAEQGRIWMVKMVQQVSKMGIPNLSPEDEQVIIARKLEKETYLEEVVPRERIDEVDFMSLAKLFMD